jgi:hypothetical protein
MKFKEDRPFANPEAAMLKLLEIANALRPITQAGYRSARSTMPS